MSLVKNAFPNLYENVLGALGASYIVIQLSKYIERHKGWLSNLLSYVGRFSLVVLCFHLIEMKLMPWESIFPFQGAAYYMCLFIGKVFWALCWIWVTSNIKFLRAVFGIKITNKTVSA